MQLVFASLKKYFSFNGYAERQEYWLIVLTSAVAALLSSYAFGAINYILFGYFQLPYRIFIDFYYTIKFNTHYYWWVYPYQIIFGVFPLILCSLLYLAATARRVSSIGWNKLLIVVTFLPLIGIIFSVLIGVIDPMNKSPSYSNPLHDLRKYFSFEGLAKRQEYWVIFAASCIFFIVGWSAYYATEGESLRGCLVLYGSVNCGGKITSVSGVSNVLGVVAGSPAVLWAVLVPIGLFSGWIYLAVAARRLRDMGWNPWISLTTVIPYLGIIPAIAIGALPSKTDLPDTAD